MSRTVTAMFDSREDAEAGKQRLIQADIDADNVRVHDQSSAGYDAGHHSSTQDAGLWGSVKNAFLPDEDRHTYEEGIRRGGYVLSADVDEHQVDEAVRALEEANSVDIDERTQSWRSEGWSYAPGAGAMTTDGERAIGGDWDRSANTGGDTEEVIPVVEEQLIVGKREVDRGGVRVRSYVTDRPVHEQVRLREERVNVERRPVDRDASEVGGDAFRERTIELTETAEEAVVGKTARVVEEVVVSKTAEERVEDVSDTVRRTEVEVDDVDGETRDRTGGTGSTSGSGY